MKIDVNKCKGGYHDGPNNKTTRVDYLCRTIKYGDWCTHTKRSEPIDPSTYNDQVDTK